MSKRHIVITGANRGIGLELVRNYLQNTSEDVIYAGVRSPKKASELNKLQGEFEGRLHIVRLDVTNPASVLDFRDQLTTDRVDILINNAGVMGSKHQEFMDMDYDDWAHVFAVNSMAPMKMTEALSDKLINACGKVATISSQMGAMGRDGVGRIAYRSSKSAVNKVMQCVAEELRAEQVAVMVLHPGWVQTDMGGASADITPTESASGIIKVIDGLDMQTTGCFMNWNGTKHVW